MELIRKFRNFIGKVNGLSGCSHCGDTWNWKKSHSIKYSPSRGMFPVCEECYLKLSIDEIRKYVVALINEWNRQSINYIIPIDLTDVEKTTEIVMKKVIEEKGD